MEISVNTYSKGANNKKNEKNTPRKKMTAPLSGQFNAMLIEVENTVWSSSSLKLSKQGPDRPDASSDIFDGHVSVSNHYFPSTLAETYPKLLLRVWWEQSRLWPLTSTVPERLNLSFRSCSMSTNTIFHVVERQN